MPSTWLAANTTWVDGQFLVQSGHAICWLSVARSLCLFRVVSEPLDFPDS